MNHLQISRDVIKAALSNFSDHIEEELNKATINPQAAWTDKDWDLVYELAFDKAQEIKESIL